MALETVTIDIDDQLAAAIEGVGIEIRDSLQKVIQATGVSDAAGQSIFSLNPGTYRALLAKSLHAFTNPYNIVVADTGGVTPQTFIVAGATLPITAPARPALCRVYGFLTGMGAELPEDHEVVVEGVGTGLRSYVGASAGSGIDPDSQGVARERRTIRADPLTGVWEVDLVRGASVQIRIPSQRFTKVFEVPDLVTANLKDIAPVATGRQDGAAFGVFSAFGTGR